jgi:hypothetical protein
MKIFRSQDKMTPEQQAIANNFERMIESELSLCRSNYKAATNAVNLNYEGLSDDEMRSLDAINHEINVIAQYWFLRAGSLIELIDKKNLKLAEQLRDKYLK